MEAGFCSDRIEDGMGCRTRQAMREADGTSEVTTASRCQCEAYHRRQVSQDGCDAYMKCV